MTTAMPRRPRGRPRDPGIEPRMYASALAVYAERGWYGFSLEAVARHASVGQSAVYRRWSSKAELLGQAVTATEPALPPMDTGSSREDLLLLARHFVVSYRAQAGIVGLRMVLDARTRPELAEQFDQMLRGSRARETRAVVQRCHERGDLRPPSTVDHVVDVVSGTTLSHVLYGRLPSDLEPGATSAADEHFLERLIEGLVS